MSEKVISELLRLATCEDIPSYRRRELLALASLLQPLSSGAAGSSDPYFDPYYHRSGMRLRLKRDEAAAPTVAEGARLIAPPPSPSP